MSPRHAELSSLLALPAEQRLEPLSRLALELVDARAPGVELEPGLVTGVKDALVVLLESGAGETRARVAMGEALGLLGDPRGGAPFHHGDPAGLHLLPDPARALGPLEDRHQPA